MTELTEHGPSAPGSDSRPNKVLPWSRNRQLERDLEHVNREIYRRNLDLAQTNKALALLQAIDALVLGPDEPLKPLCTKLTKEVVRSLEYGFVGILGRGQTSRRLEMYGWATGNSVPKAMKPMVDKIGLRGNLDWFKGTSPLKLVDLEGVTDAQIAHYGGCTEEEAAAIRQALDLKAVCCIKLSARDRLVGVMIIGFTRPHAELSDFEKSMFVRLSEAVGIAVDHKMLLEENQRIVRQLAQSNHKLRVLDKTKDDFISMASHQLRTPLTSVKGYVSMVLDGDAGQISETQRKLLNQSFLSSQRMAYLISDLLNISRLRTGKFVIEPVPCNLPDVIQQELDQLTETFKARNLEMSFHKPEKFPTVMLDETKMRQVIMNFVDNAIYYTPGGGHIDVYVEEKPESIEFRVTDDGIGVPKQEQHHLFSKFYRAKNAKRARPDGTGLGIFMAKKVVVAQGGAIIFRSAEGKGSTFGFTFPKAKLLPPASPAEQS